ncbi:MAG TPA: carbohydrate kinase family protein [Chthonomonadales bacterium]|nr:carbohydrate kinase family protein [Chthonomonadales bacterium]
MRPVHCVGIAVMDALSGPLAAYPEPGRTPQVVTETVRLLPGGGAVNTACALARMGLPAAVFSKAGADAMGRLLSQEIAATGADASGLLLAEGEATPFTFVGVHPDGERTFVHTPGANLRFTPGDLDLDRLLNADLLLWQDLWALPGLDREAPAILAEARRRGCTTLLDECWGLSPNRDVWEAALPYCDLVLPSASDLAAIYPGASPHEIADRALAGGARAVCLKLGAHGCLLATPDGRERIPALPAQVVDVTGAGDCWDAGLIAGLLAGESLPRAARLGAACAAYCIEGWGATTGVPVLAAVRERAGL